MRKRIEEEARVDAVDDAVVASILFVCKIGHVNLTSDGHQKAVVATLHM